MNDKLAVAVTYGAAGVTTVAGLTINEWVAAGGFLLGLMTFLSSIWYKRELLKIANKRQEN